MFFACIVYKFGRKVKISQNKFVISVYQDVIKLDVSMAHAILETIVHGIENIFEKCAAKAVFFLVR